MEPSSNPGNDAPPPMGDPAPTLGGLPTAAPSTAGAGLGQGKASESDEKLFAMLAHLLGIIACFIAPLVIWQIKKEESPFITDQSKEALNFQITIGIGYLIAMVLGAVSGGCLYIIVGPLVGIASIVFSILGGLDANKGKAYRYPFALRLVK